MGKEFATIKVPSREFWDSKKECFYTIKGQELILKHSLLSLSKWEAKWHIPFLVDEKRNPKYKKTHEMMVDYIRCMTVNNVEDERVYYILSQENMEEINKYITDPMTATTFSDHSDDKGGKPNTSGSFLTAEVIYYQMFELNIPLELQKWHLNRLLTLIRVMAEKKEQANNPKKMSHADLAKQNRALHAARRKPHHTPRR
ncbi:MAG: hypothetical protein J6U54_23570 [Clostridiales bacterium]|nr:hypothetical protein [Clostridiales bacterium]